MKNILLLFFFISFNAISIDLDQYREMLKNGSAVGLDVRTPQELVDNPATGALHIPIDKLAESSDQVDNEKTILIFCEAGGRAAKGQRILKAKGHKKIINIGDWRTWKKLTKNK